MIQIFAHNSMSFLEDLCAWLITPVPFTFCVLFAFVFVCQLFRGLSHG